MERAVLPVDASVRHRPAALTLIGALLLAGALALGGGSALLMWGLTGLARWPLRVVVLTALYLAPGLALLRLLWPQARALPLAARVSLALGVSVALPPLLLLLFQQVRLPWGAAATWGYLLVSVLLYVGWEMSDWRVQRQASAAELRASMQLDGADRALVGITLAALLVRLYAARDLRVGMLGDSYHHTLMAQLLVDNQGLFHSWQPYAPLASFTYHFGFHANAAFVHYMTGLDLAQSVVWAGQLLNAIAVPMVFALAVSLGGSRWSGVWAALIVGFAANIPAYYINWGRYTQLAGQIVLMAVVVCWANVADWEATPEQSNLQKRASNIPWRLLLLTALLTTAMILTHYLVTGLAALFVAGYLVALLLARRSWRLAGVVALRAALGVGLALLLAAPWLLNLARGYLLANASGIAAGAAPVVAAQLSRLDPTVPMYVNGTVLLAALLGLLVAGWRRDWRMALPALWCALLIVAVVPFVVGLPGAGVIESLTGLGTLFIPTALLAGYALAAARALGEGLLRRLSAPAAIGDALAGALLLGVIAGRAGGQSHMVVGDTALVVDADFAAIDWIRANTPPDARFLINGFPAYGGTLAAGSDAGWWLPLLAGRATSLPALTYGSEVGENPRYREQVNAFAARLRGRSLSDATPLAIDLTRPEALQLLKGAGIGYVYSGAHPWPGPRVADRIDTARLRASPRFRLVYARAGVEIFQLVKPV